MFLFILAIWGTQALQILGWPKKLFTSLFFHHMEKLWSLDAKSWLIGKDRDAGKDWEQKEKGVIEDEMLGCYYWLSGHEFEQAPGDREGQGSLVCCRPWGHKESVMIVTEQQIKAAGIVATVKWLMCVDKGQRLRSKGKEVVLLSTCSFL